MDSTSKPYFSVITPSWNQGEFIGKCLASVSAQEDSDYEHLIFDNCSTDATAEVVAKFPKVDFRREPDRGQSDAINKGFRAARGEILCWLNADDEYPEGVFLRLRQAFSDPKVMVVYGDARQVAYDGGAEEIARGRFHSRLDLIRWWSPEVKLHQPAVFFRRQALEATGLLREDLHYAMDYELWWRMSERFDFQYIPEVLAIQHRQPDSKTMRAWHKVYVERERVFEPFYSLIDGGDRGGLIKEKKSGLAERYLLNAYAAVHFDRWTVLENLWRAWCESPRKVLHMRNLGLVKGLLCFRKSGESEYSVPIC